MTADTEVPAAGTRLPRPLARLLHDYRRLAKREPLACAAVLILTLGVRAALLPWLPVPSVKVTDEFSHLLAADTYAHGRLTNPTHAFWEHFETFHELMRPTYQSKYQPLQGLVLAFGQKVFGEPWIAVYICAGLMCAALCWMLQGWIPPEWALLGALTFVCRVGIFSYWMNAYIGASVPAIGGALALGAIARILWRGQYGHSITWAAGLSILALSRPYEAAVLGLATFAIVAWFLLKSRTPLRIISMRVAAPASTVLMMCLAFVAYNDYRVTGSALTLPYRAYDRQYEIASIFAMTPLAPRPQYHHAVMRQLADEEVQRWVEAHAHPIAVLFESLSIVDYFFFSFSLLWFPVLLWPYDLNSPQEGATVFLLFAFVLMIAPLIGVWPHYAAAFAGIFYLRLAQSLTRVSSWRPWGQPVGRIVIAALVVLLMAGFGNSVYRVIHNGEGNAPVNAFGAARRSLMQTLERQPGRQLVMVRYAAAHEPTYEWVYNRADIYASPVVWAREMTPEQDRPFLEYFHDRKVWLLEPDRSPPKLSPYPQEAASR